MAVTEQFHTGDGTDTSFNFTFQYIDESDVKVSVNGTDVATTEYSFANATTILFNDAPANNAAIRIYRDTNVDELKSTFFAGSSIRAQDLNKNFEQNNFAVQEIKAYTWDNETSTIHSDEDWVSSDEQIATTAAIDARFQDEVDETIESTEAWVSDDDHIPTTLASDNRVDAKIDTAITNDIGTNDTGITITDDGDGTITLSIEDGDLALAKIDPNAIITSAEANPNNDGTIATTAKIDDMIDAAITGDIAGEDGIDVVNDGDGTITIGISEGSVDLDRIKADDIINLSEQDAGSPAPADTNIFTASAAAKRFDTLVQTDNPGLLGDWEVGKTWLQNDSNRALSIWSGSAWLTVSEGGGFVSQPNVVYVDTASGDDAATGHRISTPKKTIGGALKQINGEIEIDVNHEDFNGGSGYVDDSYTNVPLTGGTGAGLTANVTVSGGVVTAITLSAAQQTVLEDYSIGDVLSASNANLGGSGSGLSIPVSGTGDGQIIVVASGVYQETAPLQIKRRNISIIGQALRSCIVHPTETTQTNTLFELNSGSYVSNLTITGVKAGTGTGNTLDAALPTTQGWNFAFYDDAYIIKSPYIQNCTNFSDNDINNTDLNAHNPAGGSAGDTTSDPTGGGLLVNGATPHDDSPLRSMVCDSYTHVSLNGPGILVTNNGYCQATSSYSFFNKYHIKCLNGGQANLAASTTDFGEQALVADGKSSTAIFTSNVDGAVTRNVDNDPPIVSFNINAPTAGASWHGTATRPQGNMLVEVTHPTSGTVIYPVLSAVAHTDSESGAGWTVTISRPNSSNRSINDGLEDDIDDDAAVSFYLRSQIASSGHTMEYVGSGTNYSALPENGGVPDDAQQVVESNGGKVWTATTDQNGKFSVGDFFQVDQRTGFVSFSGGSVAFDLVTDTTPQLGGDLDVNGNTITGLPSTPTANDEAVSKAYVDTQIGGIDEVVEDLTPQLGGDLDVNGQTITSTSNGNIVIDPNGTGSVLINHNTSRTLGGEIAHLQIEGQDDDGGILSGVVFADAVTGNDLIAPQITLAKARGTSASPAAVQNGDTLSYLLYYGHDGTDFNNVAAGITVEVDGTVDTDDVPGKIVFSTSPTGANTITERVEIDSNGNLTINSQNDLRFADADSSNWVGFQAPATVASNVTWTLPSADAGTAGHALVSDGAGTLSWAAAGGGGGGATGGGDDAIFHENGQTVTTNYTVGTTFGDTAACNAMSAGPITIDDTVTVTINSGSNWVIV